ncbi:MAG: hypothetical protein GKS05_08780 [Nitrospirales bacterium]|nr:hypothetical protein [Nitrospirales bacterium]
MITAHTFSLRMLLFLMIGIMQGLFVATVPMTGLAQSRSQPDGGSVGLVSSVNGEATIVRADRPQQVDRAVFKGPVVYGDRIRTGAQAMLGMLVGDAALVTLQESSEVMITEEPDLPQVVNLLSGRTCIACQAKGNQTNAPVTMRTPTTTIIAQPNTLLQIQVAPGSEQAKPTNRQPQARPVLTAFPGSPSSAKSLRVQALGPTSPGQETIHVVEGSVEVISQIPGLAPVTVEAGQMVQVTGGTIGQPTAASPVSCRTQDIQLEPQHLITPPGAQEMIAQRLVKTSQFFSQTEPLPPIMRLISHHRMILFQEVQATRLTLTPTKKPFLLLMESAIQLILVPPRSIASTYPFSVCLIIPYVPTLGTSSSHFSLLFFFFMPRNISGQPT